MYSALVSTQSTWGKKDKEEKRLRKKHKPDDAEDDDEEQQEVPPADPIENKSLRELLDAVIQKHKHRRGVPTSSTTAGQDEPENIQGDGEQRADTAGMSSSLLSPTADASPLVTDSMRMDGREESAQEGFEAQQSAEFALPDSVPVTSVPPESAQAVEAQHSAEFELPDSMLVDSVPQESEEMPLQDSVVAQSTEYSAPENDSLSMDVDVEASATAQDLRPGSPGQALAEPSNVEQSAESSLCI
eukprot:NODE_535_length_867_cov_257.322581_g527_i0.p1 GENE.NODE_535_length_867_cov_257.322581_g527_i0~~NODE_535_length_867_cov_257.322581_g527_i0.p1  ORF type:complete len:244 (+),score=62.71 NODE_535_length_867_cov_257.322581_g527_i0:43-774(+)